MTLTLLDPELAKSIFLGIKGARLETLSTTDLICLGMMLLADYFTIKNQTSSKSLQMYIKNSASEIHHILLASCLGFF